MVTEGVVGIPDDGLYDTREILRYAKLGGGEAEALPLRECLALAQGLGGARAVWRTLPLRLAAPTVDAGPVSIVSRDLCRALDGCEAGIVFAATLGIGMDRLIARYQRISPVRALLLHAIGAERIEHACDLLVSRLARDHAGRRFRPRFSPGYGDLPLSAQREVFGLLDCERRIGLTLNESLVMSPSKSVTAFMGIEGSTDI